MATSPAIAKRLAAAAARISARAASTAAQAAPTTHEAEPAPKRTPKTKSPRPDTNTAANLETAQVAKPGAQRKGRGKSDEGREPARHGVAEVAASLRRQARNPDALQLVSDEELVEIARAMVENAKQRGSTGAMDRQALFRAAGLPFVSVGGAGKLGQQTGAQVRNRLEKAIQRSRRPSAVTQPASAEAEAA